MEKALWGEGHGSALLDSPTPALRTANLSFPHGKNCLFIFLMFVLFVFKDFIYLFMRDTEREREAETQAEGEAGSLQGAPCGTPSQDPGSQPEPKADTQPLNLPGAPECCFLDIVLHFHWKKFSLKGNLS